MPGKFRRFRKFRRYRRKPLKARVRRVERSLRQVYRSRDLKSYAVAPNPMFITGDITVPAETPVICLTDCAEGDAVANRTGLFINPKSLLIRIATRYPSSMTPPTVDQVLRIIVFRAQLPLKGNTPGWNDIFQYSAVPMISPMQIIQQPNFRILLDKMITLHAPFIAEVGGNPVESSFGYQVRKYYFKLNPKYKISSTGQGQATFNENHIFIALISTAPTGYGCVTQFVSRFRFTDP